MNVTRLFFKWAIWIYQSCTVLVRQVRLSMPIKAWEIMRIPRNSKQMGIASPIGQSCLYIPPVKWCMLLSFNIVVEILPAFSLELMFKQRICVHLSSCLLPNYLKNWLHNFDSNIQWENIVINNGQMTTI